MCVCDTILYLVAVAGMLVNILGLSIHYTHTTILLLMSHIGSGVARNCLTVGHVRSDSMQSAPARGVWGHAPLDFF